MTRQAMDESLFTQFSLWTRKELRDSSTGLVLSNLDYIFFDYKSSPKKIMLVEEKMYMSKMHYGQKNIFKHINRCIDYVCRPDSNKPEKYDYWGFYLLQLPAERVEAGMKLNGKAITEKQLILHLNFTEKFCNGLWYDKYK